MTVYFHLHRFFIISRLNRQVFSACDYTARRCDYAQKFRNKISPHHAHLSLSQ